MVTCLSTKGKDSTERSKIEMTDETRCLRDRKGRTAQQNGPSCNTSTSFKTGRKKGRIGTDRKSKREARQFSGVHARWPQSPL